MSKKHSSDKNAKRQPSTALETGGERPPGQPAPNTERRLTSRDQLSAMR